MKNYNTKTKVKRKGVFSFEQKVTMNINRLRRVVNEHAKRASQCSYDIHSLAEAINQNAKSLQALIDYVAGEKEQRSYLN